MKRYSANQKQAFIADVGRLGVTAAARKHGIAPGSYYNWTKRRAAKSIAPKPRTTRGHQAGTDAGQQINLAQMVRAEIVLAVREAVRLVLFGDSI